jgi:hypothetical protein
MKLDISRLAKLLAVTFAMFALAACGSGDGNGAAPAVESPVPFTIDPGIPLVDFVSEQYPYVISVPQDWEQERARFGGDYFFKQRPGAATTVANLTIGCINTILPGAGDPRSVLDEDILILERSQIPMSGLEVDEFTVGEVTGVRASYTIGLGRTTGWNDVAYVAGPGCTWRLHLGGFGSGPFDQYEALFDRILATFEPASES